MNIYQSDAYKKYLSWQHFDDEPKDEQVKKQQLSTLDSCISNAESAVSQRIP